MWNHPIHLHNVEYLVTEPDGVTGPNRSGGSKSPRSPAWARHATSNSLQFPATGCCTRHMSHHTMNSMGRGIPDTVGVYQSKMESEIRRTLQDYMAMGEAGRSEYARYISMMALQGPVNTLPVTTVKDRSDR
jgi:hypothetical protein